MRIKHLIFSSAVLALPIFASIGGLHAQDRDSCRRRIEQDRRDLERAIEEHGQYSPQVRHERDELQRDEAKCSYRAYDHDGDDSWRDNRPYGVYGGPGYESPAFDFGYRDGLAIGHKDRDTGKAFRPEKNDHYEDADHGYQRRFGDKGVYKGQYREAFERGYAEGYGYWAR